MGSEIRKSCPSFYIQKTANVSNNRLSPLCPREISGLGLGTATAAPLQNLNDITVSGDCQERLTFYIAGWPSQVKASGS